MQRIHWPRADLVYRGSICLILGCLAFLPRALEAQAPPATQARPRRSCLTSLASWWRRPAGGQFHGQGTVHPVAIEDAQGPRIRSGRGASGCAAAGFDGPVPRCQDLYTADPGRRDRHVRVCRKSDDSLHQVPGQPQHQRQIAGQTGRHRSRRLDQPVRHRRSPPQDRGVLPFERVWQDASHHPGRGQASGRRCGVRDQRGPVGADCVGQVRRQHHRDGRAAEDADQVQAGLSLVPVPRPGRPQADRRGHRKPDGLLPRSGLFQCSDRSRTGVWRIRRVVDAHVCDRRRSAVRRAERDGGRERKIPDRVAAGRDGVEIRATISTWPK